MTTAIEQTPQVPGHWLKRQISTLLGRNYYRHIPEVEDHNYQNVTSTKLGRTIDSSCHTHYDPSQIAIEEGLEAWARHAAASNGFGDLP